ncbi:MAG: nucleoid-associated protein [Bacteroidales bacterium]|nr:nucleoid-associated protein [Bacteroidales bacterium]
MQNITLGKIDKLIVHYVGNKNNEDGVRFSDALTDFTTVEEYFNQLINNNFKLEELYQFHFLPDLNLNPMYQFISSIFQNRETFIEQSKNAGRYLYDKSTHPNIKAGELCVFYVKDCKVNHELLDCIGIFKSENKDTILKVNTTSTGFDLKDERGINTNKLDKGCLIFNTEKEDGYLISIVDNTNKNAEAQYWKDDFLGIQPLKNEYHQTNQFLGIAKQFVTLHIGEEFELTKADQIDLLNRSVKYFKSNDTFEKEKFEEEVFKERDIIDSFRHFDDGYRRDNKVELSDSFEISVQAVKKQARVFKSVLKLDKNFHIYIHGNKELIEQGVDENGRKFYKIYYEEEN